MRRILSAACTVAVCAVSIVSVSEGQIQAAQSGRPLETSIMDDTVFRGSERDMGFLRSSTAGARKVRLNLDLRQVAPAGSNAPTGFDPRDPGDPLYNWRAFDDQVVAAVRAGVAPVVTILGAPVWAQGGTAQPGDGPVRPNPTVLGDMTAALAARYSGSYGGLPRVRFWMIWNEPNLSIQLMPQSQSGRPVSPGWYRSMVNAMARAVHAVHLDNVVVAGGLAPFGGNLNDPSGTPTPGQERIRPLEFMREMLCMSGGSNPRPTCGEKTEFDVWAHHPYTYGGPTHSAFHPDDVSIGDLGEMRKLLEAAQAVGHIQTRQKVGYWVTEFSYDSQPADPKGLAPALHARWVSEALYRMWSHGVSVVTWYLLRDTPFPQQMYQSGLYSRGSDGIASDKPKPALKAFRFPFVAFRQKNGTITYWGRTPSGVKKAVAVEQRRGGWKRVATPPVDRYGIFSGRVKVRGGGSLRARLADRSDNSVPFSLTVPEDFRFCPWGSFY